MGTLANVLIGVAAVAAGAGAMHVAMRDDEPGKKEDDPVKGDDVPTQPEDDGGDDPLGTSRVQIFEHDPYLIRLLERDAGTWQYAIFWRVDYLEAPGELDGKALLKGEGIDLDTAHGAALDWIEEQAQVGPPIPPVVVDGIAAPLPVIVSRGLRLGNRGSSIRVEDAQEWIASTYSDVQHLGSADPAALWMSTAFGATFPQRAWSEIEGVTVNGGELASLAEATDKVLEAVASAGGDFAAQGATLPDFVLSRLIGVQMQTPHGSNEFPYRGYLVSVLKTVSVLQAGIAHRVTLRPAGGAVRDTFIWQDGNVVNARKEATRRIDLWVTAEA